MTTPIEFLRWPYAILAGAGVSYPPPSSVPTAASIMASIIEDLRLPLDETQRQTLLAATSSNWPDALGVYHVLRFEQVIEAVAQTVDPQLGLIRKALAPTIPNEYHFALARLMQAGAAVVTPNFDILIEAACKALGFDANVIATEEDYQELLRNPDRFPKTLFKLHGTLRAGDYGPRRNDLVTEASLVGMGLAPWPIKWQIFRGLLQSVDLLVLGYSGSDDFDIIPMIAHTESETRVYWSRYTPHGDRVVHSDSDATGFGGLGDDHLEVTFRHEFFDRTTGGRTAEQYLLVDEKGAALLAARLLQHLGDAASSIYHGYLDAVPTGVVSIFAARAHLWQSTDSSPGRVRIEKSGVEFHNRSGGLLPIAE